jgi:uncharacterized protein YndB with AHSA1/START domain
MFKAIILIIIAVIVVILLYAVTRPDSFRVERSTTIKAPPEKVFALIDDFRQWEAWSPYQKRDPAMKKTFSGAPSGKGAVYTWDGNSKIGAGHMEIIESTPPSRIVITLDFTRPIKAHNMVEFTLAPKGSDTEVIWVMHGPSPYLSKLMGIFMNMDRMVGDDFEAGLANLKAVAEK